MLNNWFECKIAYQKVMENGLEKIVTETYYFEALSFTEAEKRAIEYIRPYINGEFEVKAVAVRSIARCSTTTTLLPTYGSMQK